MKENTEYTFQAGDISLNVKPASIPEDIQNKHIKGIVHSDLVGGAVNTIYYGKPDEFIQCPHCGELAELDPQVYTSMPPMYGYHCSHCGKSGYIFCHEAHIITDPNWKPWLGEAKPSDPTLNSYTECLICGEKILVSLMEPHTKICKNCKDAVIAMRKALGTWED